MCVCALFCISAAPPTPPSRVITIQLSLTLSLLRCPNSVLYIIWVSSPPSMCPRCSVILCGKWWRRPPPPPPPPPQCNVDPHVWSFKQKSFSYHSFHFNFIVHACVRARACVCSFVSVAPSWLPPSPHFTRWWWWCNSLVNLSSISNVKLSNYDNSFVRLTANSLPCAWWWLRSTILRLLILNNDLLCVIFNGGHGGFNFLENFTPPLWEATTAVAAVTQIQKRVHSFVSRLLLLSLSSYLFCLLFLFA